MSPIRICYEWISGDRDSRDRPRLSTQSMSPQTLHTSVASSSIQTRASSAEYIVNGIR
jgi:hypothetical protein